jgi:hypothetical protein
MTFALFWCCDNVLMCIKAVFGGYLASFAL